MYSNARTIRVFVHRAGEGPTLVLLHGLADDHRLWRRVVPSLQRRFDVVAIDLPGHGSSGPIRDGASIEWFADEVVAALENLGVADYVLIGLSMGGGVAQFVALAQPSRVRALVLVSTSPVFDNATRARFRDRAEMALKEGMEPLVEPALRRWFTPSFLDAHPAEIEETRDAVHRTDPADFARASLANAERDSVERLSSITCPVLFVFGDTDPTNAGAEAVFRGHLPQLKVAVLPNASHLLPVEAPDAFLAVLEPFLTSLDD
jgi:3-oxoadipate enol-lactonase